LLDPLLQEIITSLQWLTEMEKNQFS